jgi:sialidase-1
MFSMVCGFCALVSALAATLPPSTCIFSPNESGYQAFRIPGFVAINETVLAFAEGRKYGCGDFAGQHDVVYKRSTDGGFTWEDLSVLMDPHKLFGQECANTTSGDRACQFWDPTPIFDSATGQITMMTALSTNKNNRMDGQMSLWVVSSNDMGATWGLLKNITAQVYDKTWHLGTPANGHGVQISTGRLLMPVYVRNNGDNSEMSAAFYSDDHAETWHYSPHSNVGVGTSESEIVELFHTAKPTLMYNHRRNKQNQVNTTCAARSCRWQSTSTDAGLSWQHFEPVPQLLDPSCKGGIVGWPDNKALLFTNDATTTSRVNITLRVSYDDGNQWSKGLLVSHTGGYTDLQLTKNADGKSMIVIIYESTVRNKFGSDSCVINIAHVDPNELPPPPQAPHH